MSTVTITAQITDANGAVGVVTATATIDIVGGTATIVPAVAPPGTTRIWTSIANQGVAPFIYGTPVGTGLTFTPVAGQPNQWTFVY